MKRILAVLKMPKKMGDKVVKAQFIQKSLTDNANFALPYPANIVSLVQLGTDILLLVAAETAAKSKTAGAAEARNAALTVVLNDLRNIMQMVQSVADKNPLNAETIIIGGGYDVKKAAIHQKLNNDAKDGSVSGTVLLTAEGQGAHEWQMSKDQVTIINLPATSKANTAANNLTPGDTWFFRNRKILKKGQLGDWSRWIKIMVR